jgi:hypothetical protein
MRPLCLLAFLVAASACAQDKPPAVGDDRQRRADSVVADVAAPAADSVETVTVEVPLGEGAVAVRVHTAPITDALGSPGFETYPLNALNLHDDEDTSVEAALGALRQRGGRVVEVVHSGERNVTFRVGGEAFTADPNRMFTPAGRRRTLGALSAASPAAEAALAAFADSVLAVYAAVPPAVVVTLHNNTDGRYSALSYQPGAEYAGDAAAVTVHDGTDPDDFFFVTDAELYGLLVDAGFNAVLQDNEAATDDGSLSVWAAQRGTPYVNVEAQHGHAAEQERMVQALVDVLSRR